MIPEVTFNFFCVLYIYGVFIYIFVLKFSWYHRIFMTWMLA